MSGRGISPQRSAGCAALWEVGVTVGHSGAIMLSSNSLLAVLLGELESAACTVKAEPSKKL